jgi:Domain of unknown function (DUF4350)
MGDEQQTMKRLSRDTWLAIGLVGALALTTVLAVIWQTRKEALPPLSNASNEPNGARALRLWLEQIGYQVSSDTGAEFIPPAEANFIFVLEPDYDSDTDHWQALDGWVNGGGTLIVAGEDWGTDEIFNHYGFTTFGSMDKQVTAQTPLLASPPIHDLSHLNLSIAFSTNRGDLIVLLAAGSAPVMVTFRQGEGRVILASFIHPWTNAGLKESGNPELALNLLALAGGGDNIWFDEWHHGEGRQANIVGPEDWLRYTPAGHAVLFTAVILFTTLVLQGRLFGRPVPLPKSTARRASLEYITALANLSRRAGHRSEVLRQYHQSLKQHLARRYRINPELPDDEYVTQLASFHPNLEAADLQKLLKHLRSRHVSEGEMVKLAAETAEWLKKE